MRVDRRRGLAGLALIIKPFPVRRPYRNPSPQLGENSPMNDTRAPHAGGEVGNPWRMSVAPMMDWTDRHCRYFHRLLSRHALLYTEMVTTGALLHGDVARHLRFDAQEHPVALQLGVANLPTWRSVLAWVSSGATMRST